MTAATTETETGAPAPGVPLAPKRGAVIAALLAVYIVWGSTYLAIRIALEGFPPFLLSATRFLLAGIGFYAVMRLRGAPRPTRRQWLHAGAVGLLLPAIGTGSVVWAEKWVASGVAALVIATVSLWAALFQGLFGDWPSRRQWAGMALGFAGVVMLCAGDDLRASPLGMTLLLVAAVSWAFGSVWSRRLDLPKGLMAPAVEMIVAGTVLAIVGLAAGESLPAQFEPRPVLAVAYLAVFGSGVGYTAYSYLLANVRPTVATSYSYVNPLVALILGTLLAGEAVAADTLVAVPVILAGLALVLSGARARGGRAGEEK